MIGGNRLSYCSTCIRSSQDHCHKIPLVCPRVVHHGNRASNKKDFVLGCIHDCVICTSVSIVSALCQPIRKPPNSPTPHKPPPPTTTTARAMTRTSIPQSSMIVVIIIVSVVVVVVMIIVVILVVAIVVVVVVKVDLPLACFGVVHEKVDSWC